MRKQLFLICLFSLLLVSCVFGAYRYYDYSYGYGGGIGSLFDTFLNLIEQNSFLVDAIVFLVIFLVLAKKMFKDYSKESSLYIVIGIALTIGIMMYERRVGYSFIVNFGGFSWLILLAFVVYLISSTELVGLKMISLGILGLITLFYMPNRFPQFWYYMPPSLSSLLILISFVVLIIGIVKLFTEKKKRIAVVEE